MSDNGTVVVVDRSGTRRTLSKWWDDLVGLAWYPDGREVWFAAGTLGDFKSLRAVTLDGKERLIGQMLGEIDLEDIARDGRVLLSRVNWGVELNDRPPGISTERDLTWLGHSGLADLSPDGKRVLFTEWTGVVATKFTYVRQTDGTPAVSGFKTPSTLCLLELFKIRDGRIYRVETVYINVPYHMPPVWKNGD